MTSIWAEPPQLISVLDGSVAPSAGGNGESAAPAISPDGRFVLFSSSANNLALLGNGSPLPSVFPATLQVYLRDRSNSVTRLVSGNSSGTGGGNGDSLPGGVSSDGRYAIFESSASDLVPGDTNNASDIFLRDLASGTTLLVSIGKTGLPGNGVSRSPVMTPDGRYAAFVSSASNLVEADTNGIADVFVRDLQSGVTTLASVGAIAAATNYAVVSSESPVLTPDGRYVAFFSTATNLVPGGGMKGEIYVRDLAGNTTFWASAGAFEAAQAALGATNCAAFNHVLSADGHYVAYEVGCVPRRYPTSGGLVLRNNLQTDATDLVYTNALVGNSAYEDIRTLDMTPDGRFIALVANASGDNGTNTCVYVWDAQTGTAVLASGGPGGEVATNSACHWPALDASGRYLVFLSSATNLVTNNLAGEFHLYARDLQAGTTMLLDTDALGKGTGVTPGTVPRVSTDARWVVFEAPDAGLTSSDNNHAYDVFATGIGSGPAELVSARLPGLPSMTPNGHSAITASGLSAEGRFVAFSSEADNLAAGDTNQCPDVFLRDTALGTNILVSVATNGVSGDGASMEPSISADGRFVAFTSTAADLVSSDTNRTSDVFLRDLQNGTTALVSVKPNGVSPGTGASRSPFLSGDGRFVVFFSRAADLVSGVSFGSGSENIFVRDVQSNLTTALTTYGASAFSATPDGRFIGFGGAIGGTTTRVYVWDSQLARIVYTNAAVLVPLYALSISPSGNRLAYVTSTGLGAIDLTAGTNLVIASQIPVSRAGLKFSGDGRLLVYVTSMNRVVGDNNFQCDVYCYDFPAGTNYWISRTYSGGAATTESDCPDISPDGRFVAYHSRANGLAPGDTNGVADVFIYDLREHVTMLVSMSNSGNRGANNVSYNPVFSPDGQALFFQSWASDLLAGDLNGTSDIFNVRLFSSSPIPLFAATITPDPQTAGACWVTWPVVPGRSYGVQFKNSLSDSNWQAVAGPAEIVGTQGYFRDLTAAGQRYYRIVAY